MNAYLLLARTLILVALIFLSGFVMATTEGGDAIPTIMAITEPGDVMPAKRTKTRYSTVELIAEQATLPSKGGVITLGVYIKPDPGQRIFWTNPGDIGKAPSLKWNLRDDFTVSEFQFPTPKVMSFRDLNTYGYDNEILLLADVKVPANLSINDEIVIGGLAKWIVCDDKACLPDRAKVSLMLKVGDGELSSKTTERFTIARSKQAIPVEWPASFTTTNNKVAFKIAPIDAREGFNDPYLFIESPDLIMYGSQVYKMTDEGLIFDMEIAESAETNVNTKALLSYTKTDGSRKTVELNVSPFVPVLTETLADTALSTELSFLQAFFFAFLGGIILNLMPCVFPILSMKALSLVKMTQESRRVARESGLIYTVGILVAFTLIAIVMLSLRSAGAAVGWGFQMQNPLIVVCLGLLMVMVGMNLFGAFEFGTRLAGKGQTLVQGSERREAFFTGLLAVVVATPCMAPFMASALGYALTQPAHVSIAVFMALGLGLAAPYLLVSFVPAFGRVLPRPGIWMDTFKRTLAFPMIITALWLFWIVGQQLGATSMFVSLIAAVTIAFSLWAYGNSQLSQLKRTWQLIACLGLIASIIIVAQVEENRVVARSPGDNSAGMLGNIALERFNSENVENYIAEGQPTFVYFTADWCISCKANERVALATDDVAKAFKERGIKVVEGDWTMEDPAITKWLKMYNRVGVPLYLYFPKGSSLKDVTILPQILTPRIVIDTIASADSNSG